MNHFVALSCFTTTYKKGAVHLQFSFKLFFPCFWEGVEYCPNQFYFGYQAQEWPGCVSAVYSFLVCSSVRLTNRNTIHTFKKTRKKMKMKIKWMKMSFIYKLGKQKERVCIFILISTGSSWQDLTRTRSLVPWQPFLERAPFLKCRSCLASWQIRCHSGCNAWANSHA